MLTISTKTTGYDYYKEKLTDEVVEFELKKLTPDDLLLKAGFSCISIPIATLKAGLLALEAE